jgi:hypothetical protein
MEKTSLLYVFVVGQTYIFILTGSFSFVIRLKSFSVPQAKLVVFSITQEEKPKPGRYDAKRSCSVFFLPFAMQ